MHELTDRRAECGVLDGLVEAVLAGESRALVVHGEAGVGKTALLEYLADRASQCRVLRVSGVQSEMELAFAGLHQLCAPLLDQLRVLPDPQRQALRTAFGMSAGPPPAAPGTRLPARPGSPAGPSCPPPAHRGPPAPGFHRYIQSRPACPARRARHAGPSARAHGLPAPNNSTVTCPAA